MLWAVSVVLAAILTGLVIQTWDPLFIVLWAAAILSFPTLGAPVVTRHPTHPIGWMFCWTGLAIGLGITSQAYAEYSMTVAPVWGGLAAAWVGSWLTSVGLVAIPIFLLFLFPTGANLSRAWGMVFRGLLVVAGVGLVATMFSPGPLVGIPDLSNPVGIGGGLGRALVAIRPIYDLSAIPALVLGAVSMVIRLRRAGGIERLQLKWFALVGSVLGFSFAGAFIADQLGLEGFSDPLFIIGFIALIGLPVVSALAILRYRLYAIDRIISRTVSYSVVTAVLVGVYLGTVFVLRNLLPLEGELAVAGSTLAVAAVFNPLRRRVQSLVDRRFNRTRVDAAKIVEEFGRRMSNRTDLGDLGHDLVDTVAGAVGPRSVSVWLPDR